MSTRETVTINGPDDRQKIAVWARNVEMGTVVTFRKKSRSTEQNSKLHAMLGEVAKQVEWHGQFLDLDDWKDMFTASLRHARVVPGIDKGTYVPLGMHTSTLTIEEMSNLIELIYAFGAERGVVFKEPKAPDPGASPSAPDAGGDSPSLPAAAEDAPPPASSAATLSEVERAAVVECGRKLLSIPAMKEIEAQAKRGILADAKDTWKEALKPPLHDHIKAFFVSADAQIKADPSVYPNLRASALAHFAEVLDCTVEELNA